MVGRLAGWCRVACLQGLLSPVGGTVEGGWEWTEKVRRSMTLGGILLSGEDPHCLTDQDCLANVSSLVP